MTFMPWDHPAHCSTRPEAMLGIYGIDAQHIYAVGDNIIAFSAGDGVWATQLTLNTSGKAHGVWAAAADAVYVCTEVERNRARRAVASRGKTVCVRR